MRKSNLVTLLIVACLLTGIGAAVVNDVNLATDESNRIAVTKPDPIVESFERDFDREPGPSRPAERKAIDEDVLYRALNSIHWTETDGPPCAASRDD